MATLVIENLDDDIVAKFEAMAERQGVTADNLQRQLVLNASRKMTNSKPRNLHEALLNIPKMENDNDEDVFARDNHSSNRDIDWTI